MRLIHDPTSLILLLWYLVFLLYFKLGLGHVNGSLTFFFPILSGFDLQLYFLTQFVFVFPFWSTTPPGPRIPPTPSSTSPTTTRSWPPLISIPLLSFIDILRSGFFIGDELEDVSIPGRPYPLLEDVSIRRHKSPGLTGEGPSSSVNPKPRHIHTSYCCNGFRCRTYAGLTGEGFSLFRRVSDRVLLGLLLGIDFLW
jgi:hypothetical protein